MTGLILILKGYNESAYCRYLRYNVDGWYLLGSKEVRKRWNEIAESDNKTGSINL